MLFENGSYAYVKRFQFKNNMVLITYVVTYLLSSSVMIIFSLPLLPLAIGKLMPLFNSFSTHTNSILRMVVFNAFRNTHVN